MNTGNVRHDVTTSETDLHNQAAAVLRANDNGHYVKPAPGNYPHQWLWDTCFTAIGLAHVDARRAARELLNLLRGQWENGMMPHMIYSARLPYSLEAGLWRTHGLSPRGVRTSGITQPPVLAIAVEAVVAQLPVAEQPDFLAAMVPAIERYHEWLYRERDPNKTGLVALVHPWESGTDDSPVWTEAMADLPPAPRWRRVLWGAIMFRSNDERASSQSIGQMVRLVDELRRANYDSQTILKTSPVVIRDLGFNAIFAAANESLERLVKMQGDNLTVELIGQIASTRRAIDRLWHEPSREYFSYQVPLGGLITVSTVATFLPLFAGIASPERAEYLRLQLVNPERFSPNHPIPSVPLNQPLFEPRRYWRGPVWINMNWFTIRGLERYGMFEEAEWLRLRTLDLAQQHGFREYYSPLTGDGLGAHEFSWTAALILDLLVHTAKD